MTANMAGEVRARPERGALLTGASGNEANERIETWVGQLESDI
jgi:hypothetical protein